MSRALSLHLVALRRQPFMMATWPCSSFFGLMFAALIFWNRRQGKPSEAFQTPKRFKRGANRFHACVVDPTPSEVQSIAIMTITTREVSHVTILDITGRITLGDETGKLRESIRQLIAADKKKIVLNLAQVDYIDSSGVGELVSSFTTVRNSGGELKLLSLSKKVHDILQVTKLYTVFDIKDDEFTAVKSFDYFFAK
jgi:anti-sigma B factor antagonist